MARRTRFLLATGLLLGSSGLLAVPTTAQAAVGDALFQPYVVQALSDDARSVAFGDVTGDGRTDVVASTDTSLVVLAQGADGSLGAPVEYAGNAAYSSTLAIGVADLDEDADQDVVVTTEDGVQIWKQDASGELFHEWDFLPPGARDLEVADVSGDGLADLVVNTDTGIRAYWQISGDLMSAHPTAVVGSEPATEVEVGDVTGDGLPDVVSALGSTVEVRAQLPDHSFAAPTVYPSGGATGWDQVNGLALGDTSGDGLLDVHVTTGGNQPTGRVVTRLQTPNHVLGAPQARATYDIPETIEAADVTGDGRDDLLVLHGGWNRLGVYDSTPGTDPAETLFPIPYASHYPADGLAVGDVTGDGLPDVAAADDNHGVVLLEHSRAGTDTTPPLATITGGPGGALASSTATFTFTSNEAGTFECSMDDGAWSPCTSPMTYSALAPRGHVFGVRAVDLAGNVQVQPSYRQFAVVAPDTQITAGPTGTVRSTSATFSFGTTVAATYQCRVDAGAWTSCTSPATYTGLATGRDHTFEARATAGGVTDPTPAARTWTVDRAADLAVSTDAPATARKNGTLTWTTTVTNAGPDDAAGLSLAQTVPPRVTAVRAIGCAVTTTVSCTQTTLASGATWTVTVTGKVTDNKGTLTSTARVSSTSWDRVTANDSATAVTTLGK